MRTRESTRDPRWSFRATAFPRCFRDVHFEEGKRGRESQRREDGGRRESRGGEIGGSKWTSRAGPQLDTGAAAFPQDTRSNRYAARIGQRSIIRASRRDEIMAAHGCASTRDPRAPIPPCDSHMATSNYPLIAGSVRLRSAPRELAGIPGTPHPNARTPSSRVALAERHARMRIHGVELSSWQQLGRRVCETPRGNSIARTSSNASVP